MSSHHRRHLGLRFNKCDSDYLTRKESSSNNNSPSSFTTDHFRRQLEELKAENIALKERNKTLAIENHAIAKKLSKTETALFETKCSFRKLNKKIADERHVAAAAEVMKKQLESTKCMPKIHPQSRNNVGSRHKWKKSLGEVLWLQPPHHLANSSSSSNNNNSNNSSLLTVIQEEVTLRANPLSTIKVKGEVNCFQRDHFSASVEDMEDLSPRTYISHSVDMESRTIAASRDYRSAPAYSGGENLAKITSLNKGTPFGDDGDKEVTHSPAATESVKSKTTSSPPDEVPMKIYDERHRSSIKGLSFPMGNDISKKSEALVMGKENENNKLRNDNTALTTSCDINQPCNGIETPPRPRRRASMGISYREPALNTKLRQGYVFFPTTGTPITSTPTKSFPAVGTPLLKTEQLSKC